MFCQLIALSEAALVTSLHSPEIDRVLSVFTAKGTHQREDDRFEEDARLETYVSRAYPHKKPDPRCQQIALQMKKAMAVATSRSEPWAPQIPSPWEYLGPTNLTPPEDENGPSHWGFGPGPCNGRVNGATFAPFDPNTIFAASARGGVWKTTDAGVNWTPLSDGWDHIATSCVAANPILLNHYYVGTGDEVGDYSGYNYGSGIGVMVTTDAGATWVQRGVNEFAEVLISDIVANPMNPSHIIVASGAGDDVYNRLYRSPDEGATWIVSNPTNAHWYDLDITPTTAGTSYLWASGRTTSGLVLFVSTDGGVTWVNVPLPRYNSRDRLYVSQSKVTPGKVYICLTDSQKVYGSGALLGLWTDVTGDLKTVAVDANGNSNWTQTHFNNGITCFTRTANNVTTDALVVHTTDSYVSQDATGSWKSVSKGYTGGDLAHVDHHHLAPHPTDPKVFLLSHDGGLARLDYNVNNNLFAHAELGKKLGCALVTRISVGPETSTHIIAGLQDNGYAVCGNDTANWTNPLGGDNGHSAINQLISGIQYIVPPNFDKDSNGDGYILETGNSWVNRTKRPLNTEGEYHRGSPPLVLDPTTNKQLYTATNYLHRYDASAQTWTLRLGGQVLAGPEKHVRHLAVAPSDSDTVYTVSGDGMVWVTRDGGSTWKEVTGNLPVASVGHVSVHRANSKSVLVTLESTAIGFGKLFQCSDTSAANPDWKDMTGAVPGKQLPIAPATSVVRHPSKPDTWYVSNEVGVYGTHDAGATWVDLTAPGKFPAVAVLDMKTSQGDLVVGTYGRGVWRRPLTFLPRRHPHLGP